MKNNFIQNEELDKKINQIEGKFIIPKEKYKRIVSNIIKEDNIKKSKELFLKNRLEEENFFLNEYNYDFIKKQIKNGEYNFIIDMKNHFSNSYLSVGIIKLANFVNLNKKFEINSLVKRIKSEYIQYSDNGEGFVMYNQRIQIKTILKSGLMNDFKKKYDIEGEYAELFNLLNDILNNTDDDYINNDKYITKSFEEISIEGVDRLINEGYASNISDELLVDYLIELLSIDKQKFLNIFHNIKFYTNSDIMYQGKFRRMFLNKIDDIELILFLFKNELIDIYSLDKKHVNVELLEGLNNIFGIDYLINFLKDRSFGIDTNVVVELYNSEDNVDIKQKLYDFMTDKKTFYHDTDIFLKGIAINKKNTELNNKDISLLEDEFNDEILKQEFEKYFNEENTYFKNMITSVNEKVYDTHLYSSLYILNTMFPKLLEKSNIFLELLLNPRVQSNLKKIALELNKGKGFNLDNIEKFLKIKFNKIILNISKDIFYNYNIDFFNTHIAMNGRDY